MSVFKDAPVLGLTEGGNHEKLVFAVARPGLFDMSG